MTSTSLLVSETSCSKDQSTVCCQILPHHDSRQQSSTTPEYPTSKDQQQFFTTLKALMPKSAILSSLQPNPSCSAAPAPAIHRLPTTLMSLRHPKYRTMSKEDINLECHRIFNEEIKITQEEADYLEKSTKLQAQSLLWFAHRRGRITASKFSAVPEL